MFIYSHVHNPAPHGSRVRVANRPRDRVPFTTLFKTTGLGSAVAVSGLRVRQVEDLQLEVLEVMVAVRLLDQPADLGLFRPFNWIGPRLDTLEGAKKGSTRVITQFILNLVRGDPLLLVDGGVDCRGKIDSKEYAPGIEVCDDNSARRVVPRPSAGPRRSCDCRSFLASTCRPSSAKSPIGAPGVTRKGEGDSGLKHESRRWETLTAQPGSAPYQVVGGLTAVGAACAFRVLRGLVTGRHDIRSSSGRSWI